MLAFCWDLVHNFKIFGVATGGITSFEGLSKGIFSFSLEGQLQLIKINASVLFDLLDDVGPLICELEVSVLP